MTKPNLFISHSTSGLAANNRAVIVRKRLEAVLSKDWNVFLDQHSIEAGRKWRDDILDAVAQTQAAVILFNEKALREESYWVPAESLIFCFRKSLDPTFTLIPVLFDGKQLKDTCFNQYEPFQLHAVQKIDDPGGDAKAFADEIAKKFDPKSVPSSQLNRWLTEVLTQIKEVSPSALWKAAEKLNFDCKKKTNVLQTSSQACEVLRRSLVQAMHCETLERNVAAIEDMATEVLAPDAICKLLTSLWVSNEATELMLHVIRNREQKGLMVVNSDRAEVTQQYLSRAKFEIGEKRKIKVFSVANGGGDTDRSRVIYIEGRIAAELNADPLMADDGSALPLKDAIARRLRPENGQIAICSIPHQLAKPKVLEQLRTKYPRIVFLAEVGFSAAGLSRLDSLRATQLRPPLTGDKINELSDRQYELQNIFNY